MSIPTTNAVPGLPRRAVVTALVLLVGGMAVVFDSTIVSIALRALSTDLSVSVGTIQWVITGYLLALAVAIPVVGWAQARFGGKRLWLFALTVFGLASVGCSLAWDAPSLIAFRVAQGFGGGLMMPLMATLAIQQVPGGVGLGRLMAVVSLPVALGPILGPTIGGIILTWLDWRWLFLVNVPLCLVGFVLAWRVLPADPPRGKPALDWRGLVLISPALVAILYGLSNVTGSGGPGSVRGWLPVVLGLVVLSVFAVTQLRHPATSLIDVGLLRRRPVGSSAAVLFLSGASLYGSMLLLPLYFQIVHGTTALSAALLLIPQGVGALLSRTLAGRLSDSIGARWVAIVGFAVMGVATIPFALADAGTNAWWLMGVLLVRGLGQGAVMIPVMSVAYLGLERNEVPHASIITRLAQQLGGAFGTAILAVILEHAVILERATADAAGPGGPAYGFDVAFWWAVGFTAVAIVVCLALPTRPRQAAELRESADLAA